MSLRSEVRYLSNESISVIKRRFRSGYYDKKPTTRRKKRRRTPIVDDQAIETEESDNSSSENEFDVTNSEDVDRDDNIRNDNESDYEEDSFIAPEDEYDGYYQNMSDDDDEFIDFDTEGMLYTDQHGMTRFDISKCLKTGKRKRILEEESDEENEDDDGNGKDEDDVQDQKVTKASVITEGGVHVDAKESVATNPLLCISKMITRESINVGEFSDTTRKLLKLVSSDITSLTDRNWLENCMQILSHYKVYQTTNLPNNEEHRKLRRWMAAQNRKVLKTHQAALWKHIRDL